MSTIGEKIKAARESAKMTQEELGKACGTTKQTIYKYETGTVTNIPFDRLTTIAEKLNVTPSYLMGWDSVEINQDKQRIIDMLDQLSPDNLRLFAAALEATIQAKKP